MKENERIRSPRKVKRFPRFDFGRFGVVSSEMSNVFVENSGRVADLKWLQANADERLSAGA